MNFNSRYRKYNMSLWQYPPFIFSILGIAIIGIMLFIYFLGNRYFEPMLVALATVITTIVLLILNYIIVHSFEKLAEANLMKSEFMNVVSHQLRTPLTNLKWTLNLALEEKDSKKEEYFEAIQEQNERMIKLVNDLLYASRIEQGKWIFKEEKVSLESMIERLIKEFSHFAKGHNVEIKGDIERGLPPVMVDPQKISEAVSNFLNNAIHYTKKGGKIEIRLWKKNNRLRCEIKDSGVGIPKGDQKYIFQKFFRSENIFKNHTKGIGLGLFIAKNIIEASRGRVGFESKEGLGSTFWFELPAGK